MKLLIDTLKYPDDHYSKNLRILFPGSFSPFTDGHYLLAKRYIDKAIDLGYLPHLTIYMSEKNREGISSDIVYQFMKDVMFDPFIHIVKSNISPVTSICNFLDSIKVSSLNDYTIIRSNKDHDDLIDRLIKGYQINGKYYNSYVNMVNLDIDRSPIVYHCKGSLNNTPICARNARRAIKEDNLNNFMLNYKTILEDTPMQKEDIKDLFNKLKIFMNKNEEK